MLGALCYGAKSSSPSGSEARLTLCFFPPHRWLLLGRPPTRITRHDPPMEGRLRDTRRQSSSQGQADRVFEGFVVLRTLSPLRPKPSRCVSRVAHVSPLTSHLLSPRRLPLGRPPARDASSAHDVERGGRYTRGQESPSSRVPARPGRPHLVQRLRLVRTESPHFL